MTDTIGMYIFCIGGMGIMVFFKPILGVMVDLAKYLEGM